MNKPISDDFKVLLLSVVERGYMTGDDRFNIETYLKTYFDGYTPPKLRPLTSEELAELVNIEGLAIGDVVAAYERITSLRSPSASPTAQR